MKSMDKVVPRTQQERVYTRLREAILSGQFIPGRPVTLRGVAEMLDVSPMPVREALRRLTAERALELLPNRRVAVPVMSLAKLEEICDARVALETAAAERALGAIGAKELRLLREIDDGINRAIDQHDTLAYIRGNYRFHFTLYSYGESEVTIPLIESPGCKPHRSCDWYSIATGSVICRIGTSRPWMPSSVTAAVACGGP